ncbi:MAG: hypothetical protein GX642_14780 [Smithella sp.]|nr:hypothetical protein [Smithella sp.]
MTSKERVLCVLNGKIPDKVPRGENGFTSDFYYQITGKKTLCYSGWEEMEALWAGNRDEVINDYVEALCTMADALGWDYVRVPSAPPKDFDYSGYRRIDEKHFIDNEGNTYKFDPSVGSIAFPEKINYDMEVGDLPDPSSFEVDESEMDIVKGVVKRLGDKKFIAARLPFDATFPYLSTVGMEEYLIRMITDPDFVHISTKCYLEKVLKYCDAFIDAGCDAVMELADYGDNRSLIMGEDRFKEFIVPYLKILCDHIHSKGGYFIKHSDGYIMDALPYFAEIGIDGWHGIQPAIGMEIKKIREHIGDKLCLWGGVDMSTLIEGSPEDVKRSVRKAVKYGAAGGLLIACGNVIEHGAKKENYLALIEQLDEISAFPIDYDSIAE